MLRVFRVKKSLIGAICFATFALILFGANASAKTRNKVHFRVEVASRITVKIPDHLEFTIKSDDVLHRGGIVMYINSNTVTGYKIFTAFGSTDFASARHPENTIPTIEEPTDKFSSSFPTNHWGVGYSDTEDDGYIPATTTDQLLNSTEGTTFNKRAYIYIGAKINDSLPAGHYQNSVNIKVVPNFVPDTIASIRFLQELNQDVVNTMNDGEEYLLRDQRDNKYYWVKRVGNQVVMSSNLDFDIRPTKESGMYFNVDIDSEFSDIADENRTIEFAPVLEEWGNAADTFYYKDNGNVFYEDGWKAVSSQNITDYLEDLSHTEDEATVDDIRDELLKTTTGSYYPWYTATATSSDRLTGDNAEDSICPAGWRLPTEGEGALIAASYNNENQFIFSGKVSATNGNLIELADGNAGSTLNIWTSNTGSTTGTAKYFKFTHNGNGTASAISLEEGSVYDGLSIRCIAKAPNLYNLYFDANGGVDGTVTEFSSNTWEESITVPVTRNMEGAPTKAGFDLIGWSHDANATMPEYFYEGDSVTLLPGVAQTLYAVWRQSCNSSAASINDAICLQDVNSSVISSMTTNTQYELIDYRDGKTYWIAKLDDGNVWFTENLKFELNTTRNILESATSDVAADKNIVAATDMNADIRYINMENVLVNGTTVTDGAATTPAERHFAVNAYYTWRAATANAAPGQNATESICPAGWTLPSAGYGAGSIGGLTNNYLNIPDVNLTSNMDLVNDEEMAGVYTYDGSLDVSVLTSAPAYLVRSGYYSEDNQDYLRGSMIGYWVSTSESDQFASSLVANANLLVLQNNSQSLNIGLNVRCIHR